MFLQSYKVYVGLGIVDDHKSGCMGSGCHSVARQTRLHMRIHLFQRVTCTLLFTTTTHIQGYISERQKKG